VVDGISAANSNNISGNLTLNAPNVTFSNTPSTFNALVVNAGNDVSVQAAIATDLGNITITPDSDGDRSGVLALNADITTAERDINLNGNVLLNSSVALNTGDTGGGNINITGTLNGTSSGGQNLTLTVGSGNITVTGDVGSTTPVEDLQANSTTGTTRFNSTVNAATLSTNAGGETQLNGDVTTSGVQSYGDNLRIDSSITLTTTNNGTVSFGGTVNSQAGETNALSVNAGSGNITFGSTVGNITALGDLSLTADEINVANTVTGTGNLSIQPFTTAQAIAIGGSGDTTSRLDLTRAEINRLSNGFNSIMIGGSNSGNLTVASGVTFNDPVILQSGSAIDVSGSSITGQGNASVSLSAPTILSPNITTANQDIALTGAVSLSNSVTLDTGTSGGGNINITGTVNGTSPGNQNLTLTAGSGDITITGAVGNTTIPLGTLQANSTGTTRFNRTVNATTLSTMWVGQPGSMVTSLQQGQQVKAMAITSALITTSS
jgi:hypothetical protein